MARRPPRRMPKPVEVARYWRGQEARFPENKCHWIGLGEPYCMACGILVVPAEREDDGLSVDKLWAEAGLQRAHLCDRSRDGLDGAQNLVMLCDTCHGAMPSFGDGEAALLWVRSRERWEDRVIREFRAELAMVGMHAVAKKYKITCECESCAPGEVAA